LGAEDTVSPPSCPGQSWCSEKPCAGGRTRSSRGITIKRRADSLWAEKLQALTIYKKEDRQGFLNYRGRYKKNCIWSAERAGRSHALRKWWFKELLSNRAALHRGKKATSLQGDADEPTPGVGPKKPGGGLTQKYSEACSAQNVLRKNRRLPQNGGTYDDDPPLRNNRSFPNVGGSGA